MRTVIRSLAAVLTVLALAATSCAGGEDASSERVRSPSPATARPGSTDAPGGTEDATENGDPQADGERDDANEGSDDGDPAEETPHPRDEAPEGQVFPPQGTGYVYTVSGERRTLDMSAPQAYPDGATQVWEHRSTVPNPADRSVQLTYRKDVESDDWAMDVQIVWQKDEGLQWGQWRIRQGDTTYECLFTPRIRYADPPIEEGDAYATQTWTGGPTCSGTTDITVERSDRVEDANGESHDVWVITEETSYRMGSVNGTRTATHWLDPDLGVDVRTELLDEGTAGATPFRYDQTLLLAEEIRETR